MNSHNVLVTILSIIILSQSVMALSTEDVQYQLKVEYEEICEIDCVNVTSENLTTQTCTNDCSMSKLKITGEDTNHITVIETLTDLRASKLYTGYKTATLGNQSDLSVISDKLGMCLEYEGKYNACLDSNRNVSAQLLLLQDSANYKTNFTECSQERLDLETELKQTKIDLTTANKDIEENSSSKILWIIVGFAVGIIGIKFVWPKIHGIDTPKSPGTGDMPPNPGY